MAEELMEVRLAKEEREYVKVYKDFLNTGNLSAEEKMVYIALKSFVTYGHDSGQVYPSMETLCKLTSLSRPRATRTITSLINKGIVTKKRRGLTKSNLYTLADNAAMWEADTVEEMKDLAETSIQLSTEEMLRELQRRRAIKIIETKKEPTSETDQSTEVDALSKQLNIITTTNNSITEMSRCQDERYTLDQIKQLYDYEIMAHDKPLLQKDLDAVMNILYDALNTTKDTIRVAGEDKPAMVVISRLMKLTNEEILYCIDNFNKQTNKIKNQTSYMLTLLYKAPEQYHLDISNQVQHDFYGDGFD